MAVLSIAYLYISQVRGRKIARSIHRADLFAAGGGGGGGGEGGSTADAGAVDVTSDEFVVTQTKSISASVQLVGMLTRNRQSKAAQSVANPVSSSESGDSAAAPATLELGAEDIKLLKGELRLSDEEIKQNLKLFATFDVDASGYLTVPELSKMFELGQGVRVSEQTIKQLMADIDEDNDGNISFSEFVQVMVRHTRQRDANGAHRLRVSRAGTGWPRPEALRSCVFVPGRGAGRVVQDLLGVMRRVRRQRASLPHQRRDDCRRLQKNRDLRRRRHRGRPARAGDAQRRGEGRQWALEAGHGRGRPANDPVPRVSADALRVWRPDELELRHQRAKKRGGMNGCGPRRAGSVRGGAARASSDGYDCCAAQFLPPNVQPEDWRVPGFNVLQSTLRQRACQLFQAALTPNARLWCTLGLSHSRSCRAHSQRYAPI